MGRSLRLGAPTLTGFACPACRRPLDDVTCASCGERYALEGDVPVLVPAADLTSTTARQAAWFDEADAEYEIERPVGTPAFHAWLLAEKFRRGTSELRGLLPGSTALAVCGGSGMDAEFLARAGARAISADVSRGAARRALDRARRHGVDLVAVVADAERLPFVDSSVDVVYVHDGLHHVDRPLEALREMARVARRAVSVNEPASAAATRLAVRAGLAAEREQAGNRVRRLSLDELTAVLRGHGFRIVRAERYAMLYRHEPGAVSRGLSRRGVRPLAVRALRTFDPIGARIGNKLTVQAVRE
jgi:ubiquinone/menaquinone biosynthesis C-methylase UbiE